MPSAAIQLVTQMGMDGIVRFRNRGECVYLADQEVLKLYRPQSVRRIGGRANERTWLGDLGFVLREELPAGTALYKPVAAAPSLSLCPLMNLPSVVRFSAVSESGEVSANFAAEIRRHLEALPRTVAGIRDCFGADFFDRTPLGRISALASFLRAIPAG